MELSAVPPNTKAVNFKSVKDAESNEIKERRKQFGVNGDCGTLGLAISGGGIRSATFSLGILQYLAREKMLLDVDYLSTVSGGGYIGAWFYSWVRRKQTSPDSKGPKQAFESVCNELNPDHPGIRPADNPEPVEIAFLRQYSNYLTPSISLFSADTWLVAATWARNAALNMAILIATFGAAVLLIRLLGMGAAEIPGALKLVPDWVKWLNKVTFGAWAGLVAALAFLPMLVTMGRNLLAISKIALKEIPSTTRNDEDTNGQILARCLWPILAAIVYSIWLYTDRKRFQEDGLLAAIAANWVILSVAFFYLQRRSLVSKCHRAKIKEAGLIEPAWLTRLNQAMEIIGPVASAFVTACLLRVIGLILPHGDSGPWTMLALGTPLVLLALSSGVVVHIGLMGRDLPEASREWFGRLRGWLLIYTAGWLAVTLAAIYGPWLVAWIGTKSQTAVAALSGGWLLTTVAGLVTGGSAKTSGKSSQDDSTQKKSFTAEIIALVAPYLFVIGFVLAVAFGVHVVLVHELPVNGMQPTASSVERYNIQVRDNQVQLSRQEFNPHDSGFRWIYNRYWPSLTHTELWVDDSIHRWLFSGLLLFLGTLLIAGLLLSWRVDINHFSMHNFYKNRLVRCYLGASREQQRNPNPFTNFDDADDVPLDQYRTAHGYYGPYPIITSTLNVTSGGKLQYQERQAQAFVFTPAYSGFSASKIVDRMRLVDVSPTPGEKIASRRKSKKPIQPEPPQEECAYRPTVCAGGRVSVGMAIAISGAAVNPNMGYHTSTVVSFLLTLFNVRLGWWFGNPLLDDKFNGLGPALGFLYTVRELFGMANADSSYVNLSDGGHFDNMGVYELVRRRCRYIICCDGEQDPEPSFGGIGSAIRKCRTDFGVEIDLPLDAVRKNGAWNRAHCSVGIIKYDPNDKSKDGILVYLKTSMTGDEPADIREYQARAREFPQQSTNDQWFDESQFESYRRLGYHVAETTFKKIKSRPSCSTREEFFDELLKRYFKEPQM